MRNSLLILLLFLSSFLLGQSNNPPVYSSGRLSRPVMLEGTKLESPDELKYKALKKPAHTSGSRKKEDSEKKENESLEKAKDSQVPEEKPEEYFYSVTQTPDLNVSASNLVPEFWYNAYTDKRNGFLQNDSKITSPENNELDKLILESSKYIKDSFYWNFLQARQHRNENTALPYLTAAQKQSPGNALLNPELAWQAERKGYRTERDKAVKAYANQAGMSPVQVSWADWILNAVPEGALIISNGEFDTYPLWLKQGNKRVFILSLAMAEDPAYLARIIHEWDPSLSGIPTSLSIVAGIQALEKSTKPVYLCMSVRPELMQPLQKELYPVGPVLQLSKKPVGNLAELRNFYTSGDFNDSFSKLSAGSDPLKASLANLLPGLALLKKNMQPGDPDLAKIQQLQAAIEKVTGKTAGQ